MKKTPQLPEQPQKPEYPMRINKYLANKGQATRRGVDELIEKRMITINGKTAVLGDKVNEGDQVEIKKGGKPKKYLYYAYNKPKGVVTHSPQNGEKDIVDSAGIPGIFPVGRLDKDSHGLIILTNDGRITDRLLNPEYDHEKEYIVQTTNKLRPSFKEHMEAGVEIEDYVTKPSKVKIFGDRSFSITLGEGKKHQIRRMVVAMHNDVVDLQRVKIMNIQLGSLKLNSHRAIEGKELETFMKSLGL